MLHANSHYNIINYAHKNNYIIFDMLTSVLLLQLLGANLVWLITYVILVHFVVM